MRPLRALVVDDSEDDTQLVLRELRRGGYEPAWTRVETLAALRAALDDAAWDVILLDYNLPTFTAPAALGLLREAGSTCPVLVLSGVVEERIGVALMKAGARDYLPKDNLTRLNPAIARELAAHEVQRNQRETEVQLQELQRVDKVKAEFVSAAVHELRNPLNPVKIMLYMLQHDQLGALTEKQREAIAMVARNIEQLGALVQDLLDVSRVQAGKLNIQPQSLDLRPLLDEAVQSFREPAAKEDVKLLLDLDGDLPVDADRKRVTQVLFNLLSNAVKFTPPGGTIRVTATHLGGLATVRVQDSGVGLSPADAQRLFQPFVQAANPLQEKHAGTGLGLYICKGIVEAHRGRIWVESAGEGKGATFGFSLPLAPRPAGGA